MSFLIYNSQLIHKFFIKLNYLHMNISFLVKRHSGKTWKDFLLSSLNFDLQNFEKKQANVIINGFKFCTVSENLNTFSTLNNPHLLFSQQACHNNHVSIQILKLIFV